MHIRLVIVLQICGLYMYTEQCVFIMWMRVIWDSLHFESTVHALFEGRRADGSGWVHLRSVTVSRVHCPAL